MNDDELKDEKRMIVILHKDEYDDWLSALPKEEQVFLKTVPG